MRKPHRTFVVAILLGAVGFLGTGTAQAHGYGDGHYPKHNPKHGQGHGHGKGHGHGRAHHAREGQTIQFSQSTTCTTTEQNVDVQGQSGVENGREGFVPNGNGSLGTQSTNVGSSLGCNNTITLGN